MDPSSITQVIRNRRTVKPARMSDSSIDREIIEEILINANWAPTHGMTQPWRFKVFEGPSRQALADFLAATYKAITAPESFKQAKYDSFRVNPTLAGAVIAVGMKRQEIQKITELDEIMAVACAVQNMHLTATAHGLGGFWSTNVAAMSDQMRDFIGLAAPDRALGLFYLGHVSGDWPESDREDVATKVSWA
ncbi:Putative NAD(P)H nitroreductase YdjA [Stieleria maiorica]|uniref:Putative NAD(P)H nitroreductase n=1 Tax=Stieleria maiorica TaxID=2795974 RepID=A0A5B9ME33_9BACT|nr:nitroreductase [Stieleria maiorica]QEF98230.1 Putative NAD(P)H nitroreductase YdjA [Stieleria maiorica]